MTLTVNALAGVLGNDTDPDGDSLLAYLDSSPSSGAVTLNTDGSFVYTPTLNFNGVDTFTYFVVDSGSPQLSSDAATVTITVTPVNDAPVAVDDPETSGDYDTPEDTQLTILAANGVLANDSTWMGMA
jgi:large repetitive protein